MSPLSPCKGRLINFRDDDDDEIPFTLRCVQCMVTSVLQDQQNMFGV